MSCGGLLVRRTIWGLLAVAFVMLVRMFVSSASEAFWMSLPPVVLVGARLLSVIPPPQLNSPTRVGRVVSIIILILFPPSYYYFLVFVTGSEWSWREFFLVSYFFGLSFELSLLYVYQFLEVVQDRLRQRVKPKYAGIVAVILRAAFYTILVPYIFVIFAVHRPKLMPTPIAGIPVEHVEQIEFHGRPVSILAGFAIKQFEAVQRWRSAVSMELPGKHASLRREIVIDIHAIRGRYELDLQVVLVRRLIRKLQDGRSLQIANGNAVGHSLPVTQSSIPSNINQGVDGRK